MDETGGNSTATPLLKGFLIEAEASRLSVNIRLLSEGCNHDAISTDMSGIADELSLLSETLSRLHEAMRANEASYTEAFQQDLMEMHNELELVLEEVQECCIQLRESESSSLKPVAWFFKKGRAAKLQQHLEALKTTIVVMRTVLFHRKEYGTHSSPGRLAESMPHTMSEDRAILESVFAENRKAIAGYSIRASHSHSQSSSSEGPPELSPGAHGRNLSSATGVESIDVPDVLPPSTTGKVAPGAAETGDAAALARRFSKRANLGIHRSILEMKAEDAEATLRRRWIKSAQYGIMPAIDEGSATEPPLPLTSTSSEVNAPVKSPKKDVRSSSLGRALGRAFGRMSFGSKKGGKENQKLSGRMSNEITDDAGNGNGHIHLTDKLKAKLSHPDLKAADLNREFENGDRP